MRKLITEDTLNKDICKGMNMYSIERSVKPSYHIKVGTKWYFHEIWYTKDHNGEDIIRPKIVKGHTLWDNCDELLETLLAKERAITLKFIIFNEFYATVSVTDLSNVIKMFYYLLNI